MRSIFADVPGDWFVASGEQHGPRCSGGSIGSSDSHTLCLWKGVASYYSVDVDGVVGPDAVWYYARPSFLARKVKGRVAFWRGVQVVPVPTET
jgi:hypothetical protein